MRRSLSFDVLLDTVQLNKPGILSSESGRVYESASGVEKTLIS